MDSVIPETDPADVHQHARTPFVAIARDEKGGDVSDLATFTWSFPDAKEPVGGNPAIYRFEKTGKFTVSVTATLERDSGSDQISVNVIEFTGTKANPTAEDFVFYACAGAHTFGSTVCDGVGLVVVPDGDLPLGWDWTYASFQKWVGGQWVEQQGQVPDYVYGVGWIAICGWSTEIEKNAEVEWRVVLALDEVGADPWNGVNLPVYESWTPANTVVKATGDEVILHHYPEDESHTISWTISHYSALDPTFTVTVKVYDLFGTLVDTLVEEDVAVGADSVDWDDGLPEVSGVYTFRIEAEHSDDPAPVYPCDDHDKSTLLVVSDVSHSDFEWIEPPTEAQVTLDYELSRAAGQCYLTVYNHDLEEATVTSPAGGVLNAGAGPHTVVVTFEDSNEGVGRYRFVVSAEETAQDGQPNRDCEPKPALQEGANYTSPVTANFCTNGGAYGDFGQGYLEAARAGQRNRGFGPWEDSEGEIEPDAEGINADHVRRAVSEVQVFSFYGHGIVYPNDPGNDGNAIVTRDRWLLRDGALATTAAVAEGLSDDFVAYGLVDPPDLQGLGRRTKCESARRMPSSASGRKWRRTPASPW